MSSTTNEPPSDAQSHAVGPLEIPRTPRVLVAHRVFSVLMLGFGLLFAGIGLSLISKRAGIDQYNRSRGVISWSSSEQGRAEFYVVAGLGYAALYAVGFFLPRRKLAYVYLTILLPLGLWNVIGVVFAPILCIWWFRKYNRSYFGFR